MKCFYCKGDIEEDEQYCSLVSHDKKHITAEEHWHRVCFSKWIEDKVDKRVTQLAEEIKKQAMPLIQGMGGMF